MEFYENWQEEKQSAYLYAVMARHEKHALHRKLFLDLQAAADHQASLWAKKISDQRLPTPHFSPNLRARIVASLISRFGSARLHAILSAMKIRGMSVFTQFHTERKHLSLSTTSNLRAAIFGVHDGLISNVSLILGMIGAHSSQHIIIVAGISGLLAGAFSMGAGEYISVRSQREIFEHQIEIEKQELLAYPEEEAKELSLIYQARGIPALDADKLATLMISNPDTALNTLAREELGINPEELVSPIGAMLASCLSFIIGALIPLVPFLIHPCSWNASISIAGTALALFIIGTILSLFSNRNPIFLGLRMFAIGCFAGGITFMIGKLIGISV